MAKSNSSKDRKVYEVVLKELEHFKELVKGHKKLLLAIGDL